MNFVKKVVVSVGYALAAAVPVLTAALPNGLTTEEIGLVAGAFVAAFWGTFKSNTTIFAPSRPGETIMGPKPPAA